MNDKLVAQEETHAAAIKSAVSIAVQTATSALRDKYEKDLKSALAGDELRSEQVSRLQAGRKELQVQYEALTRKAKADCDIAEERISALERSLKLTQNTCESLAKSLEREEARVKKMMLERSDMESLMIKERSERTAELQQQEASLRHSLVDAKERAEKEADWEIQKKRSAFELDRAVEERDAALARAQSLTEEVRQLEKERDDNHKQVLLYQEQAQRAKRLAEEHHRSKAANVRKALSEERARARSLKGSQADSARKLAKAEAELVVLRKQVERLSEEARSARAAAKASFEANEHMEHGVLGHALRASKRRLKCCKNSCCSSSART